MVEVTQEDIAAAREWLVVSKSSRQVNAGDMALLAYRFAAHREAAFEAGRLAERKAVVEWLRQVSPPYISVYGLDEGESSTFVSHCRQLAGNIEQREHLEKTDD